MRQAGKLTPSSPLRRPPPSLPPRCGNPNNRAPPPLSPALPPDPSPPPVPCVPCPFPLPPRCGNLNNRTPHSSGFFSKATSAGLADALADLSAQNNTADLNFALTIAPNIVVLEQDMNMSDVLQLPPGQNGGSSVSLIMPLLLMGPPYPTMQLGVPPPTNVTLDLTGCLGCISVSNINAHVYLINLHISGLEQRPAPSSGGSGGRGVAASGSGMGAGVSLALWAFEFDRSSGNVSVTLRNVTLTLPQQEFGLLLAGTAAGWMAGGGWRLKVG